MNRFMHWLIDTLQEWIINHRIKKFRKNPTVLKGSILIETFKHFSLTDDNHTGTLAGLLLGLQCILSPEDAETLQANYTHLFADAERKHISYNSNPDLSYIDYLWTRYWVERDHAYLDVLQNLKNNPEFDIYVLWSAKTMTKKFPEAQFLLE